jgi:hypothetical protein
MKPVSHAIVPIVPVAEASAGVLVANFKEVRVPSEVIVGWAAVVTVAAVPVTLPVTLPVSGPLNAVAVKVPVPAL